MENHSVSTTVREEPMAGFSVTVSIARTISVCYLYRHNYISGQEEGGYRAPFGNQFLIDVSRLEKYHRKRFAKLKSCLMSHILFLCN